MPVLILVHENKGKAATIAQDMDSDLSFHNIIPLSVWDAIGRYPLVSTNVYSHHFIGAVDGVHWPACY
jgi:hypothetical protein